MCSQLTSTEFFFSLDRNLEDVDFFYNRKYGDAARRLKLLQDCYGRYMGNGQRVEREEVEDLMGALLELRGFLRKLQWYGEVNRRGFVKITKKLDKKVAHSATQRPYLESKVDQKQFATNTDLNGTMHVINEWLSKIGDIKVVDDGSSAHSSNSLQRVSFSLTSTISLELWDAMDLSLRIDDLPELRTLLRRAKAYPDGDQILPKLCLSLLQRAISVRARSCIPELLAHVEILDEEDDISMRNCLHRYVIALGRSKTLSEHETNGNSAADATSDMKVNGINYLKPAAPPIHLAHASTRKEQDAVMDLSKDETAVDFFSFLLDRLSKGQRPALNSRDTYGRTPLHYAAQYGFVPLCETIISHLQTWSAFVDDQGAHAPLEPDNDGHSPLHLSVVGGHPVTADVLLQAVRAQDNIQTFGNANVQLKKVSNVLSVAVKANFVRILQILLHAGLYINQQDDQGETALHVAARLGHTECAEMLLSGMGCSKADTERTEVTFGWTPLHVACVDGNLDVVKCLISAGAKLNALDSSGWTPREHAALRGHINIAQAIAKVTVTPVSLDAQPCQNGNGHTPATITSLIDRKFNAQPTTNGNGSVREQSPIKSFGHRYLSEESMILVSLGTMDMRKDVEAVNLDRIPLADAHSTQLDTALSVIVSASGAIGEPSIIDLPVQENISTEPIIFMTTDAAKVKLMFDIVPTYAGSTNNVVGRGVALLSSIKPSIGSKRMSLQGDITVPVMAVQTLDVIGSVHFNFSIITPFSHPNMAISEERTYWKSMASTMLIGHRGLGKNSASRNSLQLGENTIQSFIAAANLGASYVEFDVQLTKDHVPVIYHDFLVSETGIDAPVHTLTLEQFMHVSDNRSRPPSPKAYRSQNDRQTNDIDGNQETRKARSMSLGSMSADEASQAERMKHTRDFKQKGFKGNSRGNFIQAPFTTLEEMFKKLPESIGFNIEMKYPMLHESEEQEMDAYAVELNSFVDSVLTKVYDLGAKRNIIFSSFNPDVCLMLSFKQPSIPILFLTDAGTSPVGDIRASSLQEAIRFASRWNLLGVVTAATPLILAPRLVRVVKESGLVCVSYGTHNNDPELVKVCRFFFPLLDHAIQIDSPRADCWAIATS